MSSRLILLGSVAAAVLAMSACDKIDSGTKEDEMQDISAVDTSVVDSPSEEDVAGIRSGPGAAPEPEPERPPASTGIFTPTLVVRINPRSAFEEIPASQPSSAIHIRESSALVMPEPTHVRIRVNPDSALSDPND